MRRRRTYARQLGSFPANRVLAKNSSDGWDQREVDYRASANLGWGVQNPTVRTRMHEVYHPRRRSIPHTFEDRIEAEKTRLETQVARLRDGPKKDELLRNIRQLETAARLNEWLSSPGLQPPKNFKPDPSPG